MTVLFPLPTLVDGRKARISSGFGERRATSDPKRTRPHLGADIVFRRIGRAARGESSDDDPLDNDSPLAFRQGFRHFFVPSRHDVIATEAGTVIRFGSVSRSNAGLFVALLHDESPIDGANSTVYVHLEESFVDVGDRVFAGQRLGIVGAGTSSGRHLHFDRRIGASETQRGTQIDPAPYLADAQHRAAPIPAGFQFAFGALLGLLARLFGRRNNA